MACFFIRRIFRRGGARHGAATSRVKKTLKWTWLVVFPDAWIYETSLVLADSKKAIFTLAPHEVSHKGNDFEDFQMWENIFPLIIAMQTRAEYVCPSTFLIHHCVKIDLCGSGSGRTAPSSCFVPLNDPLDFQMKLVVHNLKSN